jgi:hypothetical protein
MSNDTPASKDHLWVELRHMPVIVSEEDNGDLKVEVSDDALEVADEEAMHGCWFCNAPLSIESFKTECQPA